MRPSNDDFLTVLPSRILMRICLCPLLAGVSEKPVCSGCRDIASAEFQVVKVDDPVRMSFPLSSPASYIDGTHDASSRWSGLEQLWISSVRANRYGRTSLPLGRGRAPYHPLSIDTASPDSLLRIEYSSPHNLIQRHRHGTDGGCTVVIIMSTLYVYGIAPWSCIPTTFLSL